MSHELDWESPSWPKIDKGAFFLHCRNDCSNPLRLPNHISVCFCDMSQPEIRRRVGKSQRRRDGLIQFAKDHTSQNGEDGIIEHIFRLLPFSSQRFCVDVGAWDGKHLSNTYSLLMTSDCTVWNGVLLEADSERFAELNQLHEARGNLCINTTVSSDPDSKDSLVHILQHKAPHLPKDFDFLCIDVDGSDYWLLHDLWKAAYRPKVVCIEANPTMPNDLIYIPARSDTIRHGASLAALVELAERHDYVLVETTIYNAFFVPKNLYDLYFQDLVPDTSIEALHEITMGTSIYQLYDGTLKLWGCKKMLWHRVAMEEKKMQMLPPERRNFPFAPQPTFSETSIVDMSAYCKNHREGGKEEEAACADAIVGQLKQDGFALVRGTGVASELCHDALSATNAFLQEAPESVRRSCLTKDRARRGYSPMCTENFASLIGEHGPNDLVRKFRIGPSIQQSEDNLPDSPLFSPNAWPSSEVWDEDSCSIFQSNVQAYYDQLCLVAHAIVRAICDGIVRQRPALAPSLQAVSRKESLDHTSILTLLGYRTGTRHKRTQKKRHVHPLVASHTDVGVITVLLFDGGDCATLQRKVDNDQLLESVEAKWADVMLPPIVPNDPVFVVNIADCLSELSQNYLPSTLHRVIPGTGSIPRNCLALFVGLEPQEMLTFGNDTMSYEEWRKKRIAKSQEVLKSNQQYQKL
eukprot:scaffold7738_cov133-Cylindrotheca_fusiformis.AAC.31